MTTEKVSRRRFLSFGIGLAASAGGRGGAAEAPRPGRPGALVVPDGHVTRGRMSAGARVFHLVAEEVTHEFAPGLVGRCRGYNGRVHGPTLEASEGEIVRIYVTNRLGTPTTVHWHGLLLPSGMDGVGGLSQPPIGPGETFKYEFPLRQNGTFMYHAHHDEMTQIGLGMTGLFVVRPAADPRPVDRDFALLLHEWKIEPGASRPDPNEMSDFNVLTINAKVFPATAPLAVCTGDRVRVRIGNLSPMDHHSIHLHGFRFIVTETDGGMIPESARTPETTVLVPVGSTRTIEFVADAPGDWALHCHMTHHVMNQMGHGLPNMVGVEPGATDDRISALIPDYMLTGHTGMTHDGGHHMPVPSNSIPMKGGTGRHGPVTMGGMVTVLAVRDSLDADGRAGPYVDPPGTLAGHASRADLARDQVGVTSVPALPTGAVGKKEVKKRRDEKD